MSDLPWLLVYGRLVWPAVTLLAAALGCALAWVEARRRGRESVDWGRRELARPTTAPHLTDGDRARVSGVLVVEGDAPEGFDAPRAVAATTARAERRPDSLKDALDRSSSVRATSVALRCDDGAVVQLDGPIAVLGGSCEVWTGCTLPRLPRPLRTRVETADEAGAAMLSNQHVVLASVAAGDRVTALGRLVARQDIRSVAVRWSLVPAPEPTAQSGDAPLAAVPVVHEGTARVSGPLRRAVARAGLIGAAGAFAGAVLLGELARLSMGASVAGSGTVRSVAGQPLAFRSVSADLVAAATPFRRAMALRRIAWQAPRDPQGRDEVLTVADLWSRTEDCRFGVELLARRGRYDEAVRMGEGCTEPGARWVTAQVAMMSGDAARASRLIDGITAPPEGFRGQNVFGALVHLYAGRFVLAAEFLERAAAEAGREMRNASLTQALQCGALGLRAHAGDTTARHGLRDHAHGDQGWRCTLALADLERGPARLAVLRDAREDLGTTGGWPEVDALLRLEAGDRTVEDWPVPAIVPWSLMGRPAEGGLRVPALTAAAHDALVADGNLSSSTLHVLRARLAASRAVFESAMGRDDDARRLADAIAPDLDAAGAAGEGERCAGVTLQTLIALRAGDATRARSLLRGDREPDLRAFALARFLLDPNPDATPWTSQDLTTVDWDGLGPGDGAALATKLRTGRVGSVFTPSTLAFGVRRLASGAEAMREWMAWGPRAPCWRCQMSYAGAELSHIAMTARALGLRDETAAAERQRAAMRALLLRRDVAVLAAIIETM